MYLSRIQIDTKNQMKMSDLTHQGAYHNWVERSFPNEIKQGIRNRKLWRIENVGMNQYLLILSPEKPNLDALAKYGIKDTIQIMNYDNVLNKLNNDMIVKFKMVIDPTFTKFNPDYNQRGHVYQCLDNQSQLTYIEKRSHKNGFELMPNQYQVVHKAWKDLKKSGLKPCYVYQVTYVGYLKITDVNKFKNLLCKGFGKRKAYGCGLITIVPINK